MPDIRAATPERDYHEAVGALDVLFTLREEFAQWLEEAQSEERREELQNVFRHVAAMEDEWNALVKEVPAMISAMDKKITSQRGKPPKGMTGAAWKQTIADYDAARDAWSKASADMTRANFEATVLAARDAKAKIASIMQSLDVTAS